MNGPPVEAVPWFVLVAENVVATPVATGEGVIVTTEAMRSAPRVENVATVEYPVPVTFVA